MRKVICLLGLLLCVSFTASAQDYSKIDLFAGVNYLHVSDPNNQVSGQNGVIKGFGVTASLAYNLNHWFGVVGEFGWDHIDSFPNQGTISASTMTYLAGPKVTPFRVHSVSVFAQALMGGVHPGGDLGIKNAGSHTCCYGATDAFALAAGGGMDWDFTKHLGIRLVQLDYMLTRVGYNLTAIPHFKNQNDWRYSGGVIIHLGGKK